MESFFEAKQTYKKYLLELPHAAVHAGRHVLEGRLQRPQGLGVSRRRGSVPPRLGRNRSVQSLHGSLQGLHVRLVSLAVYHHRYLGKFSEFRQGRLNHDWRTRAHGGCVVLGVVVV